MDDHRKSLVASGQITVRVPLVRCKRCRSYVEVQWKALPRHGRVWFDVQTGMVRHYVAGMSYRKTAAALSAGYGRRMRRPNRPTRRHELHDRIRPVPQQAASLRAHLCLSLQEAQP